ncbi:exopolysaccharide biosynthesis glycosyltransferase VpsL [Vibrio anguillarum]|uniref:exopolysaccharide biosynthesis glycosyltransferase VpsL n=1 Tax=Vibrio anguillarum TaxID=55601 RepID=UPI00097E232D|nr:exopolysaccharide biosynthesis glycosyltransferase VpsL [Vibrio anguillarum]ASF99380.1 undecaprenyl-phosphate glucose phosphotransferase [Vibrio anguillarum]MBF4358057.1 undecaprenyl-phosphate glucose phosphotransferase [Vibrio anguillarum]MBF4384769.1 undecaprenyl-phosphate glucose phosphotransferase [Vibrio anguillarum]MBF4393455.1 undecaprenyl-phosphate glucose phosphotransferase [Vibrio anguillarum]MBF4430331.1 undecaprenyl-phosphate glucose phosphotransferase [Vibrio anguillarum]
MGERGRIRISNYQGKFFYRLIDCLVILITMYITLKFHSHIVTMSYISVGLLGVVFYSFIAESLDIYSGWRTTKLRVLTLHTAFCWASTVGCLTLVGYFTKTGSDFSRLILGFWFVGSFILLLLWRFVAFTVIYYLHKKGYHTTKAVIIGMTPQGLELSKNLINNPELGIKLTGFYDDRGDERIASDIPVLGKVNDALTLAKNGQVKSVYIALPMQAQHRISKILEAFSDSTVNTYIVPDFFTFNLLHSRWYTIGDVNAFSIFDTPFNGLGTWLKRFEDLVLSSLILILISPVLIAVAVGVKLSSPGPIIFKQMRYGLDGKSIKVWKFRSMRAMDNGNKVTQATKNDPRVTPFGAFIRKTSLDELPQFINVLQGRMSIVGPRPHAVAHNEEYRTIVNRYMLRHKVKPGITGWAQINGWRGETDTLDKMEKRVQFDLDYIHRWSLWFDIKIVFLTVFKGFVGKNAY